MVNLSILFLGLLLTFFGLYILTDARFEAWPTVWKDGLPVLMFLLALASFFIFGFGRDPDAESSDTDPDNFGREIRQSMRRVPRRRKRFRRRK